MTDRPKTSLGDVLAHLMNCDHEGEEPDLSGGRRVEYVVTGVRGAFALACAIDDPSDTHKENADMLARKLKVDIKALPGHRFSYRVVPGNPGRFFVDFQPVQGPGPIIAP